jgi:hypothetical protein
LVDSRPPLKSSWFVGLILVCAFTVALLWTPAATLIKAILIVVPGFVLDRLRGRSGIVGGVVSSSILGVIWGIAGLIVSGEGSFIDFVSAAPALYFIFVASLLWGGLASLTLYWVVKSYREHGRRMSEAGHPKLQYTLGQLMGLVALCAVTFAALATPLAIFVAAIGIAIPGLVIDRFRGGAGVLGSMVSSAVTLVILGIYAYINFYLRSDTAWLDYLGSPVLTLFMLALAGVAWGSLVGSAVDVALLIAKSYTVSKPTRDDGSPSIVWLPDETAE